MSSFLIMAKIFTNKHGSKYITASITIELNCYSHKFKYEQRDSIPDEEALKMIQEELDELAGSNDGSELLANISSNDITFKTKQ